MTDNQLTVWKTSKLEGVTDLIPKPEQFTIGKPAPESLGEMDQGDLIVPTLQLLQPTSDACNEIEGAKAGLFLLDATEEIFAPPLRLFIVFMHNGRFKPDDEPKGVAQCVSSDGVVGTTFGACDACQYKDWGLDSEGNNYRACSDSRVFYAILPNGSPARIRFSKTSFKAARQFLTRASIERKNLWAHPTIVTVQQRRNEVKKATYYTASLSWDVRDVTPPEWCDAASEAYRFIKQGWEDGRLLDSES